MKSERLIYSLCCPITGEVHYVGKSTNGMTRPMKHLSDSHSEKIRLWVSDLKFLNNAPIIKIVEYVSSSEDIDIRERYWIQYYINNGSLLLNENLITPLTISPILDNILDGTSELKDGKSIESIKIGRFVCERRKMVGLTQYEFSEKMGIALTVIRKIEQGYVNINLKGLLDVLGAFGCSLDVVKKQ